MKRTDIDSHYIWDDGDGGVALYYDSDRGGVGRFILENRSANLFPIPTNNNCAIGSTTNKKYLCSNNNPAFFQDDKYYTLRTEFSKKTIRLYIDDTLVGNIESNDTKYFATKQILVGNRLYGGYVFQWDSSISSVKIRK